MTALKEPPRPPAEQLYLSNLELIDRIIGFAIRRSHFGPAEADDFRQETHVKLMEEDYKVFRVFAGTCTLRSYLKVVILRFGQDYRNHRWGKHHPSAEAGRLGTIAVKLELLMVRDGLSYEAARETLRTNEKVELTDEEFDQLRSRLPARVRRTLVPIDVVVGVPCTDSDPEEALRKHEASRKKARVQRILDQVMALLPSSHQNLLRLLYEDGFTIAEVARALKVPQKPLYRERDRALLSLRELLEERGVQKSDLEEILRFVLDAEEPDDDDEA